MSTDTLEYPPIAALVEEPRTEVAVAAAAALDLEKINLTDLALAKFGDWRVAVAAATAQLGTLALDLGTQARVDDAKSLRQRLINAPRAEVRKISKALRSRLAATGKDVGAAEDQIVAAWDKTEALITPQIDAAQQRLDDEKAERQHAETARVQMHQERMTTIGAYLTACQAPGMTAERIARGMAMLEAAAIGPDWEEFQVPAADLQCRTLEAMRQLHAQALGREQEAERQERIRLENERQAEANRIEAKRIADEAAEIRRQAAELAAQRAESERQQNISFRIADQRAKSAAPGFKLLKPLPEGVVPGAAVNTTGQWYSAAGLLMNEDGTRSIFCDVEEDGTAADAYTDPDPGAATLLPGEPVETVDRDDALTAMEFDQGAQVPQAATPGVAAEVPSPAAASPSPAPTLPEWAPAPTLTLGQLNRLLQGDLLTPPFKIEAAGLLALGFKTQKRPGAATHFLHSDWPAIKAKMIEHIEGLA